MRTYDLTGQSFGRLKVIGRNGKTKKGGTLWHCVCECGNECDVEGYRLKNGHTRSCGCLQFETLYKYGERHGDATGQLSELYNRWRAMKRRCYCSSSTNYKYYGGRGIEVCSEWKTSYLNFKQWALENGFEENKGLTLDRIDFNGNYYPENCRWITLGEQQRNKRNNLTVLFRGKVMTAIELSETLGIGYDTIKWRIKRGWSGEKLAKPVRSHKPYPTGRKITSFMAGI